MTGYLIKILTFKAEVVKLIRLINDIADKNNKKQNLQPEKGFVSSGLNLSLNSLNSKQILDWAVGIIKKLDQIIKHALIRFRLRGVN